MYQFAYRLEYLRTVVLTLLIVIVAASGHEFAHALAAHLLGDDTAKEQGRLTLNPLKHIDPFGSVVLPLLLSLTGFVSVAYAKPVPFNPYRLKNRRWGEAIIAIAGPLANIIQALVAALIIRVVVKQQFFLVSSAVGIRLLDMVLEILFMYVYINMILCFFNLIPLPPLDGSKILSLFLPSSMRKTYNYIQQNSLVILLAVMWLLPSIFGIDLLGWYFDMTAWPLTILIMGI